ncbi:MAG: hypothetical protein HC871_10345 [Rhizobiales bacterium]|nr:hypothetical protein [Hyphomicrobiales bacterium]
MIWLIRDWQAIVTSIRDEGLDPLFGNPGLGRVGGLLQRRVHRLAIDAIACRDHLASPRPLIKAETAIATIERTARVTPLDGIRPRHDPPLPVCRLHVRFTFGPLE